MASFPNFIVIGAEKSGTSSLCRYLDQHPDAFVTKLKEPRYYAIKNDNVDFPIPDGAKDDANDIYRSLPVMQKAAKSYEEYQAMFEPGFGRAALGEGSVWYLYSPGAPERVKADVTDVKLIALLRQPVDRAYSRYTHMLRDGHGVPDTFEKTIQLADTREQAVWPFAWHMLNMSMYAHQIERWQKVFQREQMRVFIFEEDFVGRGQEMMKEIFAFLELDPSFTPTMETQYNKSGVPVGTGKTAAFNAIRIAKRLLRPLKSKVPVGAFNQVVEVQNKLLTKTKLDPTTKVRLMEERYREDVLKLQDLLGRDLSCWLK